MVGQILNRGDFNYDLNGDALYNQYKDRYMNLGKQAMMDTMGQAAALTGGYGNSYAQMAGQQAYQGYLQGLNDKVPELYQLALDRYNQQGQDLYNKYGLLSEQDQTGYDRWTNQYNQWLNERDYLTGRYDTERSYDYGTYRDQVGDDQWMASFNEDLRRYNQEWDAAHPKIVRSGGGGGGDNNDDPPVVDEVTEEEEKMANYVKNMLDNATGSTFNPSRVIASNSNLTASEKKTAQEILKQYINVGYAQTRQKTRKLRYRFARFLRLGVDPLRGVHGSGTDAHHNTLIVF
jgi:hypothetical protein